MDSAFTLMTDFTDSDLTYMRRALALAGRGLYTAHPNPRVGCVLVKDGAIVGEGFHAQTGGPHAEVAALRDAQGSVAGATAYVTLEPCCHYGRTPPCSDALIQAGVRRVVAAMRDPNPRVAGGGLKQLAERGIETSVGLLEPEAHALNTGFFSRMSRGRPWVRVKAAISLDGRTAMASGESQWISGEASRADVQRLRARSGAILTGSGTVLADDPALNVRITAEDVGAPLPLQQPMRVVLDRGLRSHPAAQWLKLPGRRVLMTSSQDNARRQRFLDSGAELVTIPSNEHGLDLPAVLRALAQMEINEVQVEAGARLTGALLASRLVDEWVIYLAPHLMGDGARGLAALPGLHSMRDRIALNFTDVQRMGDDLRITASLQYHS